MTPIIGMSPSSFDFGSVQVGGHLDITAQLFNQVQDPRSILHVTEIRVVGPGFSRFGGPDLPIDIPGDGGAVSFAVRFNPEDVGPVTGSMVVVATNTNSLDRPLLGQAPVELPDGGQPINGEITLGPEKVLIFRSIYGDFTLRGGETLRYRWVNGVILLNGKRFRPGPTREEYLHWRGPHGRTDLARYANVPFIQQRVAVHGDTDSGWNQAYTEWDSIVTSWCNQVTADYARHQSRAQSRDFLLSLDENGLLIQSAEIHHIGLQVMWRGQRSASFIELPGEPPLPPPPPSVVSREEGMETLNSFRSFLEGTERSRLDLSFGNLGNLPGGR
jgi:hypothetical protein